MNITRDTRDDVVILRLSGRLVGDDEADRLRRTVLETVEGGCVNILLDFGGVTSISSVGLGSLITNHVTLSCSDGALKLVNVPEVVKRVLDTTFLSFVFTPYATEDEAMDSFW